MNAKLFETIADIRRENLRQLQTKSGLEKKDFAEKIGVQYVQLNHYIGKNPSKGVGDKVARRVESNLELPEGYLDHKHDEEIEQPPKNAVQKSQEAQPQQEIKIMDYRPPVEPDETPPEKQTPVISWVQAGDFTAVVSASLDHVIRYIPYNPRAGKYGFALIVNGASMEPDFKADEFIYINPTFQIDELHTGSLVVMACDGDTEATFKELVVESGKYYLRPLNPNWHEKIIPIDHTCRLVGKVVGKYVEYN